MKIPDDLRRTITDAADKIMDSGKNLGNQAQLMANVKKLQIEHAKRVHELGKQTFAWFESGKMIVSGPVPPEVAALCGELAGLKKQIDDTQAKLEEAKQEGQVKFLPSNDTPPNTQSTQATPADTSSTPNPPDNNSGGA